VSSANGRGHGKSQGREMAVELEVAGNGRELGREISCKESGK
jgi:hypothetical protein